MRALDRSPARWRIDLVLLELGEDGHTASLFPGSPAVHEQTRWVMAARAAAASMWRITLTPAVINAAVEVLFLVSGGAKAGILRRVLEVPAFHWNCRRRRSHLPMAACTGAWMQRRPLA